MIAYQFDYDVQKNIRLKTERNISFEEIISLIEEGKVIDVLEHPNQEKYKGQKIFIIDIEGYLWLVPYIEKGEKLILRTAFPSRKLTKLYKRGTHEKRK